MMKKYILWILLCPLDVFSLIKCQAQNLPPAQVLPIKPARTISFTTTEGTGIDLDVSPDGKILVFNLLGDLYTLPVAGGRATQLTHGMAINIKPIWSPDGKMIAYISDVSGSRHINVRDLSGRFHTVLNAAGTQFSPQDEIRWTLNNQYIVAKGQLYALEGGVIPIQDTVTEPLGFADHGHIIYYVGRSNKGYHYMMRRYHSRTHKSNIVDD